MTQLPESIEMESAPFELRHREVVVFHKAIPANVEPVYAVMLRGVSFPGPQVRDDGKDGRDVHDAAVVAAEYPPAGWAWLHLASATKEALVDALERSGRSDHDVWNFFTLDRLPP